MRPKRDLLAIAKLYVIVDADACGDRDPVEVARQASEGGADIIQWRAKNWTAERRRETAQKMVELLRPTPTLLIINDHPDLALELQADGVHLGQDDLSLEAARLLLKPDQIIGISTHSPEQAVQAQARGADYIGVGPVFATPTKPTAPAVGLEFVRFASEQIAIPFFAIGGIDRQNLALVLSSGARRVAVVRAVCAAADVSAATQTLKSIL